MNKEKRIKLRKKVNEMHFKKTFQKSKQLEKKNCHGNL